MNKHIFLTLFLLFLIFLNTGCGQDQKTANNQPVINKFSKNTTIEGTVSSGRSLFKTGMVEVSNENGQKLKQVPVVNGRFQIEIPSGTNLPLVLSFSSETHPERLVSVVAYENVKRYYIDPSTTAIAKAAITMGGYTRSNLISAAEDTTHTPDANKTTTGWRGDPTTQYGGWH
jgi:hypothetical protein